MEVDNPIDKQSKAIVKQLEYYFSDFNLPRDKHLLQLTKQDNGWVEIKELLKFKRLLELTKNQHTSVIHALSMYPSKLLELTEDETKIRRILSLPVPEFNKENIQETKARSVMCRGFSSKTKLDDLLNFFSHTTKIEAIKMRYIKSILTGEKKTNGCITVIFQTLDDAKYFMSQNVIKYKNRVIKRKWQLEFEAEICSKNRRAVILSDDKKKKDYILVENISQRKEMSKPLEAENFMSISNLSKAVTGEEVIQAFKDDLKTEVMFVAKVNDEPKCFVYCLSSPKTIQITPEIQANFGIERTLSVVSKEEGEELCKRFKEVIHEKWAKFPKRPAENDNTTEDGPAGDAGAAKKIATSANHVELELAEVETSCNSGVDF